MQHLPAFRFPECLTVTLPNCPLSGNDSSHRYASVAESLAPCQAHECHDFFLAVGWWYEFNVCISLKFIC